MPAPVTLIPIWAAMPLGVLLARRMSPAVFDRFILGVLIVLALKLLLDVV